MIKVSLNFPDLATYLQISLHMFDVNVFVVFNSYSTCQESSASTSRGSLELGQLFSLFMCFYSVII